MYTSEEAQSWIEHIKKSIIKKVSSNTEEHKIHDKKLGIITRNARKRK